MTEISYFFDRITGGDATLAPYDTEDFSAVLSEIYGTDFVVGGYMNNLLVTSTGGADGSVWIYSGAAVCKGVFFETDDAFAIVLSDQGGGVNRLDRIVLRYDSAAQTVRPYVIEGVAAAVPTLPALTADDMPLWYVYVPDGFTSASTVSYLDIHDERVISHPAPLDFNYYMKNYMPNSEFMAYSQPAAGATAPEMWLKTGAVPVILEAAAIGDVMRGKAIDVQLGAGDTLSTNIVIPVADADNLDTTWYTLKGIVKPKTGDLQLQVWSRKAAGTTVLRALQFTRLTETHEFVTRFQVDTTTEDSLEIFWYSPATGATFEFGQMILSPGLVPGPFRKKSEFILFDTVLEDTNWTADAYGDATTTISLDVDFGGGTIMRDTKGLLANLRVTSAANVGASLYALNKVVSGDFTPTCVSGRVDTKQTNTSTQEQYAFIGITNTAARQFRLVTDVEAGAQTFTVQIVGIWV